MEYREELWRYAQEVLDRPEHNLLKGQKFSEWMESLEVLLRKDCYNRPANTIVARQLLPVFEHCPAGWGAVAYFRASLAGPDATLKSHLLGWRAACPDSLRSFVTDIAGVLSVSLPDLPPKQSTS